ncbi:MAG: hypothetical protein HY907_20915 [Deltaproteobacteria bacterium]|nr:hypothetical protein [Deltaproteobacteria bacterium]
MKWTLMLAAMAGMACPPPAAPGGGESPLPAITGDEHGLRLIDLRGNAEPRELLLGGGWAAAAWIGCTDWLALDRTLGTERGLSVLDVQSGQLIAVGPGPIESLMRKPEILDALVGAFGVDAAYPEDRLQYGALRRDDRGTPVVEVIGAGEGEQPDHVVGIEPLELPLPVARALEATGECAAQPSVRWVLRSPYGTETLEGAAGAGWTCERVAGSGSGTRDPGLAALDAPQPRAPHDAKDVGRSSASPADQPLVVEVPGAGEVPLPDSAPVEAYELCAKPGGGWRAVRVEQPGEYGYHVLYVVRDGDGAVWEAARYVVTDLTAAGVAAVDGNLLLFGGPDGWFLARDEDDPERLGDIPPAIR